jgi:drug/metabolite transporter (DMT)-like permease
MLRQSVSLVGAALILAAYLALQRGWLPREDRRYNALNFFGSVLLTWVAVGDRNWGFIVLEGSWALLSLPPLLRPPTRRPG